MRVWRVCTGRNGWGRGGKSQGEGEKKVFNPLMKPPSTLHWSLGSYSLLSLLQGQGFCLSKHVYNCTYVKYKEHTIDAHTYISWDEIYSRKKCAQINLTCLYHISKYWLFIYTVCSLLLPDSPNRSILTRLLWDSRTKALRGKGSEVPVQCIVALWQWDTQAYAASYYYTLLC